MSTYKLKITTAITTQGARGGSSLAAIKKALKVEPKQFRFINAALNKGVQDGTFVKVGGKYKVDKPTKPVKKKKTTGARTKGEAMANAARVSRKTWFNFMVSLGGQEVL